MSGPTTVKTLLSILCILMQKLAHTLKAKILKLHIKIQTHKRFKRTLLVKTKHNLRIFGVIPFIKLKNDT